MNLFIHLLSLILDGVSPVVLNLAEHNGLEPRLDLRSIPSRLAVCRQGVDISVLVADHGNRGNEVLKGEMLAYKLQQRNRQLVNLQQFQKRRTQQYGPP